VVVHPITVCNRHPMCNLDFSIYSRFVEAYHIIEEATQSGRSAEPSYPASCSACLGRCLRLFAFACGSNVTGLVPHLGGGFQPHPTWSGSLKSTCVSLCSASRPRIKPKRSNGCGGLIGEEPTYPRLAFRLICQITYQYNTLPVFQVKLFLVFFV
jgi:hypothetical protein